MDIKNHHPLPTTKRTNKNTTNIRPIYKHWLEDSRKNNKKQELGFIHLNLTKHVIPVHLIQYEIFLVKLQGYLEILFENKSLQISNVATLYFKCLENVSKHLNCYKTEDIQRLSNYMSQNEFDYLHFLSCFHNTLTPGNVSAFARTNMDTIYFSNNIKAESITQFADQLSRVFSTVVETTCDSWEELEDVEVYDGRLLIRSVVYLQDEFTTSSFRCITYNFRNLQSLQLIQTNLTVNDIKMEEDDANAITRELFRCLLEQTPQLVEISLHFCQWIRWQGIQEYIPQIQALQASHRLQWQRIEIQHCLCYLDEEDPKYNIIDFGWRLFVEKFESATNIRISFQT